MSAEPQARVNVRALTTADLPEVLASERAAYDYPWSEGGFRDCMRVGYRCLAAVDMAGNVLGYGLLSVTVDEAHVLNVCVGPLYRRRGVATLLLEHMARLARGERAATMLLEVRPSNAGALALYRRLGFERVGVRKRYYPAAHGREDALLLARPL